MRAKTKIFNFFRSIFKIRFLEKWLRSKTQGKTPASMWVKLLPNNYQYKKNSNRLVEINGIKYELNISDYENWRLYFGILDKGLDNLFSLIKPTYTILDIGANIGYVSLTAAKLVGKDGQVFGFEPDPINFERCMKNVHLNNFPNLTIFPYGMSSSEGKAFMKVRAPLNRGGNQVVLTPNDSSSDLVEITLSTIDTFVFQRNLQRIDLIKIDVEGHELHVLRGAQQTIQRFHPILYVEVSDINLKECQSSPKELLLWLQAHYEILVDAETLNPIDLQADFTGCHFDVIAFPTKN